MQKLIPQMPLENLLNTFISVTAFSLCCLLAVA